MSKPPNFSVSGAPCHYCTDRHPKCHSECKKYAEWRATVAEISAKKSQEYILDCIEAEGKQRRARIRLR